MQVINSDGRLLSAHHLLPKVAILITNQVQCQYRVCYVVLFQLTTPRQVQPIPAQP